MAPDKYLSIYLNDHLVAFVAARDVARRARRSNEGAPLGDYLNEVERELEDSRRELASVMQRLGIRRSPLKRIVAWGAEKVGRLKLNGHLVRHSPLSRVVELEGLIVAADIEARTWAALEPYDARDSTELVERCERRRQELTRHHAAAVRAALG